MKMISARGECFTWIVLLIFGNFVYAVPPHTPDLLAGGNVWEMHAYLDNSPVHGALLTHKICFFNDGTIGTHQKYVWISLTFPGWNGRARQEGDQIFMHGDFPFFTFKNIGHSSMEWEIVTDAQRTEGAGHWRNWFEDNSLGSTIGFANIKFVRSGNCGFSTASEALKYSQSLQPATGPNGEILTNPMGISKDNFKL